MSVPIPIAVDAAFFDQQVQLDGVTYTLQFRWNVRASSWFMDIMDADGSNIIRGGLKLVTNWPLWAYSATRTPPGAFIVVDTTGAGNSDPDLEGLGQRWQLVYFTAADLGL